MATKPEEKDLPDELADLLKDDPEPEVKDEPVKETGPALQQYVMRDNPTEEQVNLLLHLGYNLYAITPATQEFFKNGAYRGIETKLVYHFML